MGTVFRPTGYRESRKASRWSLCGSGFGFRALGLGFRVKVLRFRV